MVRAPFHNFSSYTVHSTSLVMSSQLSLYTVPSIFVYIYILYTIHTWINTISNDLSFFFLALDCALMLCIHLYKDLWHSLTTLKGHLPDWHSTYYFEQTTKRFLFSKHCGKMVMRVTFVLLVFSVIINVGFSGINHRRTELDASNNILIFGPMPEQDNKLSDVVAEEPHNHSRQSQYTADWKSLDSRPLPS